MNFVISTVLSLLKKNNRKISFVQKLTQISFWREKMCVAIFYDFFSAGPWKSQISVAAAFYTSHLKCNSTSYYSCSNDFKLRTLFNVHNLSCYLVLFTSFVNIVSPVCRSKWLNARISKLNIVTKYNSIKFYLYICFVITSISFSKSKNLYFRKTLKKPHRQ